MSDKELTKVLDKAKYFYEPRVKEWKEQHEIYNDYNNPDIYSIQQIINGDDEYLNSELINEFVNWYDETLVL